MPHVGTDSPTSWHTAPESPGDEPGALAAHAGIRAGGGWQQPLLPRQPAVRRSIRG
jgi:hypothetical protein